MLQLSGHGTAHQTAGRKLSLGLVASQSGRQQTAQTDARSSPRQPLQVRAAAGFAIPAQPQPSPGRLWSKQQPRVAEKAQRQQEAKVAASSKPSHSNSRPQQ